MEHSKKLSEPVAVLDLGSSAIRFLIGQQTEQGDWRILDKGENSLSLGKDVFGSGYISSATARKAIDILRGFKEVMAGYGIKRYLVVGTSALREARNRDGFIDRILINTGIEVQVLSGVEANQMTYLAVESSLSPVLPALKRNNVLILEVGGGSTEVMLLKKGRLVASEVLNIGSVRYLERITEEAGMSQWAGTNYISLQTHRLLEGLARKVGLKKISCLVALGTEVRLALEFLEADREENYQIIRRERFHSLIEEFRLLTVDEVALRLNVPYGDAELFLPGLIIYDTFFEFIKVDQIIVPDISIREGLLQGVVMAPEEIRELFREQILASCRGVAQRYAAGEDHYEYVRDASLLIYDVLWNELGLEKRHRLLLEAAAILHDIGSYISGRGHHKHGAYLVNNAEIFGLNNKDKKILAQMVRYHRKSKPQQNHEGFGSLDRVSRLTVQKLSAILRIADALDRSHTQRINIRKIYFEGRNMVFLTDFTGDLTLERFSLQEKADLLEEVFGFQISLRSQGIPI